MVLLSLALKTLRNRLFTTTLTIVSIALSVALLLGVERVRLGARDSFSNTISQTDLIVGARGGSIQLLLYSVFHMGSATNNISYKSYEDFKKNGQVDWTIPISLGDSHKGYRVVATNQDFFLRYRFRYDRQIEFELGGPMQDVFEVVVGDEVARNLRYQVGQKIVLTHGVTEGDGIIKHEDKPFTIVGVLKRTATPVDRGVYITLEGMEAIHMDWQSGAPPLPGQGVPAESIKKEKIKVGQITAFLLRTKSRIATLYLQRDISNYSEEALMAIIPGVALSELWRGIAYAEESLKVITLFVLIVSFLGMVISLYTSLNERRREMAILRAVGAGPGRILALLVFESAWLTLAGIGVGIGIVYGTLYAVQPFIERKFGLYIPIQPLSPIEWIYLGIIFGAGLLMGLLPAIKAYRNTLSDGLTVRV